MKGIVVGMGEALWDVLPEGKKLGGAPANFAYHVSQFGLDSCVVSAVGDDPLGHEIIENFTSKGLNQHIAEVPYPPAQCRWRSIPPVFPNMISRKMWHGTIYPSPNRLKL